MKFRKRRLSIVIVLFAVFVTGLFLMLSGCQSDGRNNTGNNAVPANAAKSDQTGDSNALQENTVPPVNASNNTAVSSENTDSNAQEQNSAEGSGNTDSNISAAESDSAGNSASSADDSVVRMNWEDLEKEYGRLDDKGKVVEFEEYGFSIFISNEFVQNAPVTDTDPNRVRSIASFSAKDRYTLSIIYCVPPYDTRSLDEVAAKFAGDSTTEVSDVVINGVPFVKIELSKNNVLRFAAKASYFMKNAEENKCIIFSFTPTNKAGHESATDMAVFSIRAVQ